MRDRYLLSGDIATPSIRGRAAKASTAVGAAAVDTPPARAMAASAEVIFSPTIALLCKPPRLFHERIHFYTPAAQKGVGDKLQRSDISVNSAMQDQIGKMRIQVGI